MKKKEENLSEKPRNITLRVALTKGPRLYIYCDHTVELSDRYTVEFNNYTTNAIIILRPTEVGGNRILRFRGKDKNKSQFTYIPREKTIIDQLPKAGFGTQNCFCTVDKNGVIKIKVTNGNKQVQTHVKYKKPIRRKRNTVDEKSAIDTPQPIDKPTLPHINKNPIIVNSCTVEFIVELKEALDKVNRSMNLLGGIPTITSDNTIHIVCKNLNKVYF